MVVARMHVKQLTCQAPAEKDRTHEFLNGFRTTALTAAIKKHHLRCLCVFSGSVWMSDVASASVSFLQATPNVTTKEKNTDRRGN